MEVDIDNVVVEECKKTVVVDAHIAVQEVGIVDALVVLEGNFVVDSKIVDVIFVHSQVFVVDGKDSLEHFGGADFDAVACT